MGHRMSSLPIVQFCGAAGALAKGRGAGRAAAMSSAFHAKCEATSTKSSETAWNAQKLWSLLSDHEKREVLSWKMPADVEVRPGVTLTYETAEKEIALGLDMMGGYTGIEEHAVTWGHADFGWVVDRFAYVVDIKKSVWTVSEGTNSLQLHAYARAFALQNNCTHYVAGIWLATEGEWRWSPEAIELASARADELWERIYFAATNDSGQFATGDHCDHCWQRLRCPEHVLPAAAAATFLAPVAEGQIPTPETAAVMLTELQRAEKVLAKAKENLGQWVKRGELRIENETKEWRAVRQPGNMTVDMAAVERAVGSLEPFKSRGMPYDQLKWCNKKGDP